MMYLSIMNSIKIVYFAKYIYAVFYFWR